jgi:hypothetical protein
MIRNIILDIEPDADVPGKDPYLDTPRGRRRHRRGSTPRAESGQWRAGADPREFRGRFAGLGLTLQGAQGAQGAKGAMPPRPRYSDETIKELARDIMVLRSHLAKKVDMVELKLLGDLFNGLAEERVVMRETISRLQAQMGEGTETGRLRRRFATGREPRVP